MKFRLKVGIIRSKRRQENEKKEKPYCGVAAQ